MFDYAFVAVLCWFVLIVVWLVSALWAKRSIHTSNWGRRFIYIRIGVALVLVLVLTHLPASGHVLQILKDFGPVSEDPFVRAIGATLCVAGVALAIWARFYLGRNWGMPMSLKEDPELVVSGPYAYIRHPIYAGILLAEIGSVITISMLWLVPFVIYGAYFFFSAPVEEKIMTDQFPDSYPDYKKRTKMLIPFLL